MLTMHPVVLHGSSVLDQERLPLDEFEERYRATQCRLREQGMDALIIYSDVRDFANICYLTNYIPKHSYAVLCIPAEGEPRLLAKLAGTRDIPYVQTMTWVQDIRAVRRISQEVRAFIEERLGDEAQTIGLCGAERMPYTVYKGICSGCEPLTMKEADEWMAGLLRRKRPRELSVMRDACGMLAAAVVEMKKMQSRGGSVAAAVIEAERAARNLGAQDIRALISLDGGATLCPLVTLSEIRSDPLIAYVSLEYIGYWAEAFVTLTDKPGPIVDTATEVLNRVKDMLKPGLPVAELYRGIAPLIAPYELHPIANGSFGYGIGLSVGEGPLLRAAETSVIEAENVYSVHACLRGPAGECFMQSAIIAVHDEGNEVLWTPLGGV